MPEEKNKHARKFIKNNISDTIWADYYANMSKTYLEFEIWWCEVFSFFIHKQQGADIVNQAVAEEVLWFYTKFLEEAPETVTTYLWT